MSCASHQSLRLVPESKVPYQTCKARGSVEAHSPGNDLYASFRIVFHYAGARSSTQIQILDPFSQVQASIAIDEKRARYQDAQSSRNLSLVPIFHEWFHKRWWEEIAFTFGLASVSLNSKVWVNDYHQPKVYEDAGQRRIECEYSSPYNATPEQCVIQSHDLKVKLRFSLSSCGKLDS